MKLALALILLAFTCRADQWVNISWESAPYGATNYVIYVGTTLPAGVIANSDNPVGLATNLSMRTQDKGINCGTNLSARVRMPDSPFYWVVGVAERDGQTSAGSNTALWYAVLPMQRMKIDGVENTENKDEL